VTLDYPSIISRETSRIVEAYERDRSAAIPWSDRWTVATVARHVAGTHHVVAEVIRERPDADFGLFAELRTPPKDAPEFVEWFRSGTSSLLEQLSSVPAADECWSWYEAGGQVGWWARRMALEALVHRADADMARGLDFSVAPEVAADGVDEYLDVFVAASRRANHSPAGPTISFECTDRSDRWCLDLSEQGSRLLSREALPASVGVRGSSRDLLLALWGRAPFSDASGLEASGNVAELDRWPEFVPPM
jgi:uncharacterized protein (TIGR03083 family)